MVITALGVSVRRLSAWRMTPIGRSPKIDNTVVQIVNWVVDHVK